MTSKQHVQIQEEIRETWIYEKLIPIVNSKGSASGTHNPIVISNIEKNTKYRFQEDILNTHFSRKR
jgi:hypothetical protein